jgi:PhnB protein
LFSEIKRKGDIALVMKLTPYLLFDGNCAEAMTFYQKCLGGELTLTKLGDTPMKDQMPPEQHNKITYAHLKSGAIDISATDWMHPTRTPKQGNTVCLYISEATSTELRDIFDKLSEGADPTLLDPLRDMPFGSYGHLADKYGVHWFFQGEKRQEA